MLLPQPVLDFIPIGVFGRGDDEGHAMTIPADASAAAPPVASSARPKSVLPAKGLTLDERPERAIRPLALGRKNYLSSGSDTGGERAAHVFPSVVDARESGLVAAFLLGPALEEYALHENLLSIWVGLEQSHRFGNIIGERHGVGIRRLTRI